MQCLEKMCTAKHDAAHTDSDFIRTLLDQLSPHVLTVEFCASLMDNNTTFGILELGIRRISLVPG